MTRYPAIAIKTSLLTSILLLRLRRTFHIAVRTKHAAISGERFEPRSAARAFVKENAGVDGHLFRALKAAFGTSYDGRIISVIHIGTRLTASL